jgi:hypothetical protein
LYYNTINYIEHKSINTCFKKGKTGKRKCNMEWFEHNQDDRIKEVFSKFTIKDFWDWWNNDNSKVMEVRIKDYKLIKEIASELGYPYSLSGIYVWSESMLKSVIKRIRQNNVIAWFGVNGRKKNYNKYGTKQFAGQDSNITNIDFIFIDIDRTSKNGEATNLDLKNADVLCNKILEKMQSQGWAERYIKLCTGNGVQLLFPLDVPIKLPGLSFDLATKMFLENDEMEQLKNLIREGIGKEIVTFSKKHRDEFNVEVDKSGFNIGRVASLPFTKNYKYWSFTWRGIVEMKSGTNAGLSDYCLMKLKDIKHWRTQTVFVKHKANHKSQLKSDGIFTHPLVKFMLDNDLPHGQINNLLWMQMKCILRDNGLLPKDENVKKLHNLLQIKYKDKFSLNYPQIKYRFEERIINRYCANNLIPPLYDLSEIRKMKEKFVIGELKWEEKDNYTDRYDLIGSDMFEDMRIFKDELVKLSEKNGKCFFANKVYIFTNACVQKYGEKPVRYYFDYWFKYFLEWR